MNKNYDIKSNKPDEKKSKKYVVCSDNDFERVAFAALKKVFSPTLFPRILANIKNDILSKNFQKFADFYCFFEENSQKFANFVHIKCFDIGLFFKKINQNSNFYHLKIFDGTGHLAGSFVTNIFDKMLFVADEDFLKEKEIILNEYEKIDKSKLLVQIVKSK